ncbi:hypothetical protein BLNAU_16363 [Blattamonas nauphoetae]|uniref:Uncharacterized protein n=1 Tax=Blattamonas nauphoetae TaxID=2049346 RepID=A0ABQ9XBL9_9EUKA|nr:hypothetical protein BLNAU_16363 [Blattamonas nauphoetae]
MPILPPVFADTLSHSSTLHSPSSSLAFAQSSPTTSPAAEERTPASSGRAQQLSSRRPNSQTRPSQSSCRSSAARPAVACLLNSAPTQVPGFPREPSSSRLVLAVRRLYRPD